MSKVLSGTGGITPDQVNRDYDVYIDKYKNLAEKENAGNALSRHDKVDLARAFFEGRIAGAKVMEMTGKPVEVPSLSEDANGRLVWGQEMASERMTQVANPQVEKPANAVSRYAEAAARLGEFGDNSLDLTDDFTK